MAKEGFPVQRSLHSEGPLFTGQVVCAIWLFVADSGYRATNATRRSEPHNAELRGPPLLAGPLERRVGLRFLGVTSKSVEELHHRMLSRYVHHCQATLT